MTNDNVDTHDNDLSLDLPELTAFILLQKKFLISHPDIRLSITAKKAHHPLLFSTLWDNIEKCCIKGLKTKLITYLKVEIFQEKSVVDYIDLLALHSLIVCRHCTFH